MPLSLKSKLSKLRYKGQITDTEYQELIKKLEGHDEHIRQEVIKDLSPFFEQVEEYMLDWICDDIHGEFINPETDECWCAEHCNNGTGYDCIKKWCEWKKSQEQKLNYQCSCYMEYPNKLHLNKNGTWKCVDKYEKCEDWNPSSIYGCITHCRRKDDNK